MNHKRCKDNKEKVKAFFIPNLSVIHDGKELPVVTTIQATYEWSKEYSRAELYRNLAVAELIIIIVLLTHSFV
ncbi:hypothetical protein [Butyrivibrio proteoclasticus]|uniref:hypothetical protein n=1 Tax=Butyrivibrio proteoclasticus TaxID=43305 RepID=UPI00047B6652|nr:hypothetical protein [Butyrivibrio proteoclasticus]